MTKSPSDAVWPERLMIRDTGLYDDMGGGGQRIYTTSGRGYERREYVRADLYAALLHQLNEAEYDRDRYLDPTYGKYPS